MKISIRVWKLDFLIPAKIHTISIVRILKKTSSVPLRIAGWLVCIRQYWTKPNASFIFSVLVLCTQPQVNMMFVMLGRGHTIALVLGDYHRISVLAWTHTKLMLECKPSTSRSHSKKQRLLACCCWQIKIKNVSNNLKSIILKSTNIHYSCDFVTKFRTYRECVFVLSSGANACPIVIHDHIICIT
jgi:hypothetical protein